MYQKLPSSGPARAALRQKGQFWTPQWVAEAMIAYVIGGGADEVFDPAVGEGAFFRAAKKLAAEKGKKVKLLGTELDPTVLHQAEATGLTTGDLSNVEIRDFLFDPPKGLFKAIVANPPYIRHHRLSYELKTFLRNVTARLIGKPLDGRAGGHVYFLVRALERLAPNGRLAFIMSADTCEGVFAPALWDWITGNFCLEAVVTFSPDATPFPGVDTNPIIFMLANKKPSSTFAWARCVRPDTPDLMSWIISGFRHGSTGSLWVYRRSIEEALTTGLSRPPIQKNEPDLTLGQFAQVVRGVATGANEFFFLTRAHASALGIPKQFLVPAIGRTRDVRGAVVTNETLEAINASGRPTLLFAPDGRPLHAFPKAVREYLEQGEERGLNKRPLIALRAPWYKMERRHPPPILFAYLGRRNARFIRNLVGVVPLTGFLCVYPKSEDPVFVEKLWSVLQHPQTIANLNVVGKSYGDGCIKVEPRALEKLPLPCDVVRAIGLKPAEPQLALFNWAATEQEQVGMLNDLPRTEQRACHGKTQRPTQKRS